MPTCALGQSGLGQLAPAARSPAHRIATEFERRVLGELKQLEGRLVETEMAKPTTVTDLNEM